MIWLDSQDIVSIFVIAFSISFNIFLLYLPFQAMFGKKDRFSIFFIPSSISIYILLGYVFYSLKLLNYYPIIYAISFSAIDLLLLLKRPKKKLLPVAKQKISFNKLLLCTSLFLIISATFIYYFFYGAIHQVAPDNSYDVYNHMITFDTIKTNGQAVMNFYPPGFHILLYPAYLILGFSNLYRFSGPIIGLIVILNLYITSQIIFSNKTSRVILILLILLPLFKSLNLAFITFWPTTISHLLFPTLLFLLLQTTNTKNYIKKNLVLFALNIFSLSLTIPYLLLQLVPTITFVCVLTPIIFPTKNTVRFFSAIFMICIISIIVIPAHLTLQTQIVPRFPGYQKTSFPAIPVYKKDTQDQTVATNVIKETNDTTITTTPTNFIKKANDVTFTITSPTISAEKSNDQNKPITQTPVATPSTPTSLWNNLVTPSLIALGDAITPKAILPFGLNTIKSYLFLLISFLLLLVSVIAKEKKLLIISLFSFLLGLISQFGFLELTHYRGRTGLYFTFMSTIVGTYLLDKFIVKKIPFKIKLILFTVILVIIFRSPPPRSNNSGTCPKVFEQVRLISNNYQKQKFNVIYKSENISIVDPQIVAYPFNRSSLDKSKTHDSFIILQKNFCDTMSLAEMFSANTVSAKFYQESLNSATLTYQQEAQSIGNSPEFQLFTLYWKDDNISIYFRPKIY